ncbi:formate dehydrogenase accessory sulfurtransferase FdhD [Clostridia bacterium]|nr:formate dehydrogenase accessory sulfurtransferase FdhD [Clostridia bacterium]
MYYTNKDIIRYEKGHYIPVRDKVIMEDEIEVICGKTRLGSYPCTNKERDLLALGLAYCNGYQVNANTPVVLEDNKVLLPEIAKRTQADCIISDLRYDADDLLNRMQQLRDRPGLFALTGGTHNGALIYQGELTACTEDISRHCMLDKLIGVVLKNGWDFSKIAILLSCRVSESIMRKLVAAGFPIAVSMSAVTDKAIEIANERGMTLAGFARGNRMNIYAGDRIGKGEKCD